MQDPQIRGGCDAATTTTTATHPFGFGEVRLVRLFPWYVLGAIGNFPVAVYLTAVPWTVSRVGDMMRPPPAPTPAAPGTALTAGTPPTPAPTLAAVAAKFPHTLRDRKAADHELDMAYNKDQRERKAAGATAPQPPPPPTPATIAAARAALARAATPAQPATFYDWAVWHVYAKINELHARAIVASGNSDAAAPLPLLLWPDMPTGPIAAATNRARHAAALHRIGWNTEALVAYVSRDAVFLESWPASVPFDSAPSSQLDVLDYLVRHSTWHVAHASAIVACFESVLVVAYSSGTRPFLDALLFDFFDAWIERVLVLNAVCTRYEDSAARVFAEAVLVDLPAYVGNTARPAAGRDAAAVSCAELLEAERARIVAAMRALGIQSDGAHYGAFTTTPSADFADMKLRQSEPQPPATVWEATWTEGVRRTKVVAGLALLSPGVMATLHQAMAAASAAGGAASALAAAASGSGTAGATARALNAVARGGALAAARELQQLPAAGASAARLDVAYLVQRLLEHAAEGLTGEAAAAAAGAAATSAGTAAVAGLGLGLRAAYADPRWAYKVTGVAFSLVLANYELRDHVVLVLEGLCDRFAEENVLMETVCAAEPVWNGSSWTLSVVVSVVVTYAAWSGAEAAATAWRDAVTRVAWRTQVDHVHAAAAETVLALTTATEEAVAEEEETATSAPPPRLVGESESLRPQGPPPRAMFNGVGLVTREQEREARREAEAQAIREESEAKRRAMLARAAARNPERDAILAARAAARAAAWAAVATPTAATTPTGMEYDV